MARYAIVVKISQLPVLTSWHQHFALRGICHWLVLSFWTLKYKSTHTPECSHLGTLLFPPGSSLFRNAQCSQKEHSKMELGCSEFRDAPLPFAKLKTHDQHINSSHGKANRTWTRTWGFSVNHSRTLFPPPPPNKYNLSLGFSEHLNRSLSPKLIVTSVFDFCLTFRCTGCSSKMWIFQIWRHDWNGSRIGFGNVQLI